ncbi:MAG: competence damage-inducible protein A [Promethearchaeota archaeon]|nr:MAG: competence damage-inducible protein A [Candidatus Lokiarchaeota archaeon]
MNVELLVIGNEILIGKTQDTNSYYMTKRITKYGHNVKRITAVGDVLDEISDALTGAINRTPGMIITCGGLGPTFDDMTLLGVGRALNRELKLNKHAFESIKKRYKRAYEKGVLKLDGMTKEREKMAYLPEGSTPLPNIRGTAPGVKIKQGETVIFCLPGVPMEMKAMFKSVILPILKEKKGKFMEKNFIFTGIGESHIAPYITEIEDNYPELWIKTHPRLGEYGAEIEVSITAFNVEDAEELADKAIQQIKNIVLELNGKIKK